MATIRSGWITQLGSYAEAFEAKPAASIEVQQRFALSSGTADLHLGFLSLGVGAGDIVLKSTMTFAATENSTAYTGLGTSNNKVTHTGVR